MRLDDTATPSWLPRLVTTELGRLATSDRGWGDFDRIRLVERLGLVTPEQIEALPSPQAAQRLTAVRGIGAWSAAVVLLRGFGRLDVFPMKDSGVARSLKMLSRDPELDAGALLEALGPVRGFLYFHLLLGRMRRLTPG